MRPASSTQELLADCIPRSRNQAVSIGKDDSVRRIDLSFRAKRGISFLFPRVARTT